MSESLLQYWASKPAGPPRQYCLGLDSFTQDEEAGRGAGRALGRPSGGSPHIHRGPVGPELV